MEVISKQINARNCIVCGMENELGIQAPFYNMKDGTVVSVFKFKEKHQSYPERTHGGIISCMLDEVMGRALWVENPDVYAVTTSMNIKFRKPVPYNEKLKARGMIVSKNSRGFSAKGEILDKNNNVLAMGEGIYLIVSPNKITSENNSMDNEMIYNIKDDVTDIDIPPLQK